MRRRSKRAGVRLWEALSLQRTALCEEAPPGNGVHRIWVEVWGLIRLTQKGLQRFNLIRPPFDPRL
jgi:hypothetical protein